MIASVSPNPGPCRWTNEGMEKYNDLLKQVKADWAKDSEFEENYLEQNRRKKFG